MLLTKQTLAINPLNQRKRKVLEESANQDKRVKEEDVLITPLTLEEDPIEVAVEASEVETVPDTMKIVLKREDSTTNPATIMMSQEASQEMSQENQESQERLERLERLENQDLTEAKMMKLQEEDIEVEDLTKELMRMVEKD